MNKLLAAALFVGTLPCIAAAQDVSQDPTLAPPSCKKPVPASGLRKADGNDDFNEKFAVYKDCISAYADTQNKLANAHVKAGNSAINDLNAFVKETNDRQSNH